MHDARNDRLAYLRIPDLKILDILSGTFTFGAHFTYVKRLETIWADGNVSNLAWQVLLNSLLTEWADSNLLVRAVCNTVFSASH